MGRFQQTHENEEVQFFEENSCYAQNWVNGTLLGPKSVLLNFSLNLFFRFF